MLLATLGLRVLVAVFSRYRFDFDRSGDLICRACAACSKVLLPSGQRMIAAAALGFASEFRASRRQSGNYGQGPGKRRNRKSALAASRPHRLPVFRC